MPPAGLFFKAGKALAGSRLDDQHAAALFENPGVVAGRVDLDRGFGAALPHVVAAHALGHPRAATMA
jgi:hypothetical protein